MWGPTRLGTEFCAEYSLPHFLIVVRVKTNNIMVIVGPDRGNAPLRKFLQQTSDDRVSVRCDAKKKIGVTMWLQSLCWLIAAGRAQKTYSSRTWGVVPPVCNQHFIVILSSSNNRKFRLEIIEKRDSCYLKFFSPLIHQCAFVAVPCYLWFRFLENLVCCSAVFV